jgi:hypothetical protein
MITIVYCVCGAKTWSKQWRADGWMMIRVKKPIAGKREIYICPSCRASFRKRKDAL